MILGATKAAPRTAAYWEWQELQDGEWETIQAGQVVDGQADVRYQPTTDQHRIVWISEANAVIGIEDHVPGKSSNGSGWRR